MGMKVVHLASQRSGGAGIAAFRLHTALRQSGVDSIFAAHYCETNDEAGTLQIPSRYLRFYERALIKLNRPATRQQKHQRQMEQLGADVFYSSLESDHDLLSIPEIARADRLHLHWTAGLLDWPSFFSNVKQPLTWTFHDQQTYLGGFHYEIDMQRASEALRQHNVVVMARQKQLLALRSNLVCVSPSTWMMQQAQQSDALARHRHEHIPYCLDTGIFRPLDQGFARDALGLPRSGKLLAFIAENLSDYRKGGDLLHEALQRKVLPAGWSLALAGKGQMPNSNYATYPLGSIADERLMALLYNAADGFVLPSRQDNLPNVIIESLCCGTPVISFATGGIPDMVTDGQNGVLAPMVTADSLAEALTRFQELTFDREAIATEAHRRYAPALAASRYQQIYQGS